MGVLWINIRVMNLTGNINVIFNGPSDMTYRPEGVIPQPPFSTRVTVHKQSLSELSFKRKYPPESEPRMRSANSSKFPYDKVLALTDMEWSGRFGIPYQIRLLWTLLSDRQVAAMFAIGHGTKAARDLLNLELKDESRTARPFMSILPSSLIKMGTLDEAFPFIGSIDDPDQKPQLTYNIELRFYL